MGCGTPCYKEDAVSKKLAISEDELYISRKLCQTTTILWLVLSMRHHFLTGGASNFQGISGGPYGTPILHWLAVALQSFLALPGSAKVWTGDLFHAGKGLFHWAMTALHLPFSYCDCGSVSSSYRSIACAPLKSEAQVKIFSFWILFTWSIVHICVQSNQLLKCHNALIHR